MTGGLDPAHDQVTRSSSQLQIAFRYAKYYLHSIICNLQSLAPAGRSTQPALGQLMHIAQPRVALGDGDGRARVFVLQLAALDLLGGDFTDRRVALHGL